MESDDLLVIIILILLFYIWQKDYIEQLKQVKSLNDKVRSSHDGRKLRPLRYEEHINRHKHKGKSEKQAPLTKEEKEATTKPLKLPKQEEVAEDKQVCDKIDRPGQPDRTATEGEPNLRKGELESKSRSPSQEDNEERAEDKVKKIIPMPERQPTVEEAKGPTNKGKHKDAEKQQESQPIPAKLAESRAITTEKKAENEKERHTEPASADASEHLQRKDKSKNKVAALPPKGEESGIDMEARKLEKKKADVKKEDQGVGINLGEADKVKKQKADVQQESAAAGADLIALRRRKLETAAVSLQPEATGVHILKDSPEIESKVSKEKRPSETSSGVAREDKQAKGTREKKAAAVPTQIEAGQINIEARKLEKQHAEVKKEEQGADINLGEGNKRRKQEAVPEKDSAAIGADLVALKRRSPVAATGVSHSELVGVNIPDDSAEPASKLKQRKERLSKPSSKGAQEDKQRKNKSKGNVGALPAESEAAGTDIEARKLEKKAAEARKEDQGVDINLGGGNKRRREEATAEKDSAAVGADLVALKRRSPVAATGVSHSELVDVNIPDDSAEPMSKLKGRKKRLSTPSSKGAQEDKQRKNKSRGNVGALPAESEAAGIDIEARKQEKKAAEAKKEDQGVDINLGEGNKRRKQEATAEKDSAAVGADLVALKRRSPVAATGVSHSELVDVNIPDDSAEPASKLKERKKRLSKPSSKGAQEDKQRKNKSRGNVGALPAESEAAGIDIEARKQEKKAAEAKKEDQGVDINLGEGNKRRKQEATAEKDSAAVGADLVALKRRSPVAATGVSHSELVDVNIPDDSAEPASKLKERKKRLSKPSSKGAQEDKQRKNKSRGNVGALPAESEAAGIDIEARKLEKKAAEAKKEDQGVDINLGEGNKRRRQEATAEKDSAAVGADLVALKRRSPVAATGVSHSELVDVNIPDDSAEPASKLKERKKRLSKPSSKGAQEDKQRKNKTRGNVGALPAESEAAGVDIEARKLEKRGAEAKKEDHGVDINLAGGNKRRKQEAMAEKESAAVGAELIALRRRNPEAAVGVMQSEAVEANLPDNSAYKSGNRNEQEQVKTAPLDVPEGGLAALNDDKSRSRKGHSVKKTRRQNASVDKDDIALNADLVALVRRSPSAGRVSGAQAVGIDLPDDDGESKNAAKKETNKRGKKKRPSKDKEVITAELADKVGDDAQRVSKKRGKSRGKQKIGGIKDDKGFAGNVPQASQKKKKKNTLRRASSKKVKTADSPLENSAGGEQVTPTSGNEEVELNKGAGKLKSDFPKGKEPQDQPNIGIVQRSKGMLRKSRKKKGKKSEKGAKDNEKEPEPPKQEDVGDVKVDVNQKDRRRDSKDQRKRKPKKKTGTTPPLSGNEVPVTPPNGAEEEAGKTPNIEKPGPAPLNVGKDLSKPKKSKKRKKNTSSKSGGKIAHEHGVPKPVVEATKVKVEGEQGVKAQKRGKAVQAKGTRGGRTKKKKEHDTLEMGPASKREIHSVIQVCCVCCSIECGLVTLPGKKLNGEKASSPPTHNRIIGGWAAPPHSFPWIVQVRKNVPLPMQSFCGGTLIQVEPTNGTEFALTAAHCLYIDYTHEMASPEVLMVTVGAHKTSGRPELHERTIPLLTYLTNNYTHHRRITNDIALLRLKKVITYNEHVLPVCIPESGQEPPSDSMCFAAGWGLTENGMLSTMLRVVEVRIQPEKACKRHRLSPFNPKTMICTAARPTKKGTCMGDSGGPMVCYVKERFVQFGVVSWGEECGDYTVFTNVAYYSPWLKTTMHKQRISSPVAPKTQRQLAAIRSQVTRDPTNDPAMVYAPSWTAPAYTMLFPVFLG
ncbi:hypothetical protein M513_00658 [Trichuris suis]|uniref:Peptidase S1 domain-containing protein n=1 Tax=Trichuris suis TaxID=68888 RepID=A0A085MMI6_9BILA|nr:hypothetical protein M513_00658 [Trichuris suis]